MGATEKELFPMSQFHDEGRQRDILPGLHNSLVIIDKLSYSAYFSIFFPQRKGVEIYDANNSKIETTDKAIIQRCQYESGLSHILLLNEGAHDQG